MFSERLKRVFVLTCLLVAAAQSSHNDNKDAVFQESYSKQDDGESVGSESKVMIEKLLGLIQSEEHPTSPNVSLYTKL